MVCSKEGQAKLCWEKRTKPESSVLPDVTGKKQRPIVWEVEHSAVQVESGSKGDWDFTFNKGLEERLEK